jgi:hypothetical protein
MQRIVKIRPNEGRVTLGHRYRAPDDLVIGGTDVALLQFADFVVAPVFHLMRQGQPRFGNRK